MITNEDCLCFAIVTAPGQSPLYQEKQDPYRKSSLGYSKIGPKVAW